MRAARNRCGKGPAARLCMAAAIGAAALALGGPVRTAVAQNLAAEDALVAGKAAIEDGLYGLAEKHFERYIEQASSKALKAEGTLWLVQALYGQGRCQEMLDLLDKRQRWGRRDDIETGFAFWRAMAKAELGFHREALAILKKMPREAADPLYVRQGLRLRAKCHLKLGDVKQAQEAFAEFQSRFPEGMAGARSFLDWAALLIEMERLDEALTILRQLVQEYPDSEPAQLGSLWLGEILIRRADHAAAGQVLQAVAGRESAPPDVRVRAWYALAQAREAETNLAGAVEAIELGRALAVARPLQDAGSISKGRLLIKLGQVEEGVKVLHEWVVSSADTEMAAGIQLDLAQSMLDKGLNELALQEFQNYLDAFSDEDGQFRAQVGKGWALFELGRHAEAATAFDKACTLARTEPQKKRALLKTGDALFAGGQFNLARDKYLEMTKTFPGSPEAPQALFQASECLARQGRITDAEKDFQAIEDAYPDSPFARQAAIRIAGLREEQGDWSEAMRRYNSIMQKYRDDLPTFVRALHGRGLVRYRMGRFDEALADFEQAVEELPAGEFGQQSFYMRGWTLYLMGQDEQALQVCKDFIERYPDSAWAADVLFWLAEYHYNHESYTDAERRAGELASRYPQHALADDALYWAGRAAAAQKEYLRAIEHYNALTQNYPASPKIPDARFQQGDALSELGEFAGAILAFDEVVKKHPNSYLADLARGRRGDCQFTLGSEDPRRYEEALISYETVLKGPQTTPELKLQAEYKIGRCKEKMGRSAEAFEHYMNVVYAYLAHRMRGGNGGSVWFTRAAFGAAALKEAEGRWREALTVYGRVIEADVPAAQDARERVRKLRLEHWFL